MSCTERVVVLVDMDCFYCQVEEKLDPSLEGKPIAVVQYNAWRGGGIIAVNYPAREKGVTRHMRGNDAKQKCPEIVLARVPEVRGKADLTKYREAGKRVADVLQTFTPILERASVDEAYLDITDVVQKRIMTDFSDVQLNKLQNTYVVGYDIQDFLYNVNKNRDYSESNYRLALGAIIVEQIRAEVFKKTGYKCSAGIAHNKILAKLVCGLHKPNKQTILPQESVPKLYKELPLKKLTGLGGKFGITISDKLNISKVGELVTFSEKHLLKYFDEKTAKWLYNIARGIDYDPVTTRLISKSIGCCKKFPGRSALTTAESVDHWVNEFISEILERLEEDLKENNRRARQITLHFTQTVNGKEISNSRTLSLNCYDHSKMTQICLDAIKKYCMKSDGTYDIRYLGFSVGNFELNKKTGNISSFFENMRNFNLQKNAISENSVKQESDWLKQNVTNTELSPNIVIEGVGVIPDQHDNLIFEKKSLNGDNTSPSEEQISFSGNDEIYDQTYQDNTSIYSAETDDLNEDIKSLIFYEDIYPESVATEPIFTKPLSENKYKTNDTILKNSCHTDSFSQGSSSSFFSKYFENCNIDNCYSSPTERDFDTSKILTHELEDSDEIKSHESIQITKDKIEEKNIKSQIEFDKLENKKLAGSNICPECRKNIPKSELGSHMDYHYALNIVKEEAHLYKPTQSSTLKQVSFKNRSLNNHSKLGIKKRMADMKPILTYLQTDELNEENSELCSECNKRIKLDDVINHMDYHTAKKLHLEINATLSVAPNRKNVEKIHVKRKKKRSQK